MKVVVGFAAGGPTDVIARIVSDKLSAKFGEQFYVVNQPGAGSNTATGMVATSPADGHTLLVVSTGFVVNPSLFSKVPYDPFKDFAPISIVAVSANVVSVHPSVPAKTMQELIKANPGKYSFAAPGVGSTPHLSGELFRLANNLDLPTVQLDAGTSRYANRHYRSLAPGDRQSGGPAEVQQRLDELGFQVVANSPAEFAARMQTEMEKWALVIRDAKIKPPEAP